MTALPLQVQSLSKYYGSFCAVKSVDFTIEPGKIFGLLGPNGAGKTSIISVINTLETPSAGDVLVFDTSVRSNPRKAKSLLGCVPQELIHHGFFSIEEILHQYSGYYGIKSNHHHIEHLLERLDLAVHRHKRVKELSGGMKRRLLIARALLHKPKLVLLDEPTAGVDLELRTRLWEFVRELRDEGVTFLITTHYIEEAQALCDKIAIINHGSIVETGPTQSLISKYASRAVTIEVKEDPGALTHQALVSKDGLRLTFQLKAKEKVGSLLHTLPFKLEDIRDLSISEGTLEQALMHILERKSE